MVLLPSLPGRAPVTPWQDRPCLSTGQCEGRPDLPVGERPGGMDMNEHEWGWSPSMTNRARMHLRHRDLDIPTSWEGANPGTSYESETTHLHGLSGTRALSYKTGFLFIEHGCTGLTGLTAREAVPQEADPRVDRVGVGGDPRARERVWEFRVGTEAMVELKTVETLAQLSCASCASMSIGRLTMLDFERIFRHPAQGVVSNKHHCVGLCFTWAHRHLLPPPTRLDTHRRRFPWADAHG